MLLHDSGDLLNDSLSTSSSEVGLEFIPRHIIENLRFNITSKSPFNGDTESVEQEVQGSVELFESERDIVFYSGRK